MKNYSPRLLRLVLLAGLLFGGAARSVLAQGNDNPTGTAGVFNGNSTTGCSYDPYTSNATRTIPDITVAGAVGGYPLQWSRTMNSRAYGNTFGLGAAWRHSYQWIMADSETFNTFEPGAPSSYGVAFPDGRFESFSYNSTTNTCAPFFPGIADRFTPLNLTTLLAYLVLPDGGMVEFKATKWKYHSPDPPYEDTSGYTYKAQRIIDPNGLSTWFTYDTSGKLTQVTEPAGRWLKIYYRTDVGYVGFVNHVDAGYGTGTYTQIVTYVYGTFTYGTSSYKVLTGANYSDGTAATYSYQHSNVSPYTGTPLILNCYDVRYPGPMKNIAYEFVQNGFYGQLSREKHTSGAIVVTLTGGSSGITRTETRGDGAVRTFTYGANAGTSYKGYLLLKQSDFLAQTTNYTYDASGYLSSIKDANLNTTSFTRLAATGAITKITHPGDASHIDYTYEDPTTGYHLKTVTDELFHTTTYLHSNTTTMTTSSVNYPDGGVELFSYNGFNQVTSHTMVSNASGSTGGIETYTYDTGGRGLLKTYTPPTATDGATNYTYDVNDRLSTIKDGRGNTTTLYHDQVGRLTIIQHPDTDQSLVGYAYNPDGTLQSMSVDYSATAAAATSYTYDDYKRLLSVTTPDRFSGDTLNHTTYFWYDKAGNGALEYTHADSNVTRTVLPSGKIMKNVYDADFRKTSSIAGYGSADAATTSFTYDNIGNLWTLKDPNGQSTGKSWSYTYDPRDRLITVDDATINDAAPDKNSLGHTVNFVYDAASNKKSERRANDQVITYDFYDAMNRLLQMTVPQVPTAAAVSHYTWTKAGKLDTFTDPNGKIYNYDYDTLNRLSTTTYPTGGGTETRTYDLAGNLATFKNRAGNIQTFTYDARNRETFYSWNSGAVPRWLYYDDASNITACNDGNANITRVYYNDFLLKSETETINNYSDGIARTVTYTYDADGRRASLKYPSGKLFTYDYTGRGQLSHLYDPAITGIPFQAKYGHDASGNRTARNINGKTTFDDANFSSSYYDAVNRITSTQHYWATANPTWSRAFRYGYDAMGNRQYESRDWQGKGDGFQYDLNRKGKMGSRLNI